MISLTRSIRESELQRQLLQGPVELILDILRAMSEYPVETDRTAVIRFRRRTGAAMDRVRATLADASGPQLPPVSSEIREALREYRDSGKAWLERLHNDLATTSQALGELLSAMQSHGSDAEQVLRREIATLGSAADAKSLEGMRQIVSETTAHLVSCAEALRREKDALVCQLKSEIQSLQKSLDEAQRAATLDAVTGLTSKDEFVRRLRRSLIGVGEIGVVHVSLRNLRQQMAGQPEEAVHSVLAAIAKRIHSALPAEALPARWRGETFCVLVPAEQMRRITALLAKCCSGRQAWVEGDDVRAVVLQAAVTAVQPQRGEDADALIRRLDALEIPAAD